MAVERMFVARGDTFSLMRPNVRGTVISTNGHVDSRTITTSAAAIAVPSTSVTHVLFSCTKNFVVSYNSSVGAGTAAFGTTSGSTTGVGCELNPAMRYIQGIVELSVIAEATGFMSLSFYGP